MNATEESPPKTKDEELLEIALRNLKERGVIEYDGEFGSEITTFIPFVAWLKREGLLKDRRVVSYRGMQPYYFFLDDGQFQPKPERRMFRPEAKRKWPSNNMHTATLQQWHACPDYRSHYAGSGRSFDRPVLFIQNKFAVEWNAGPINYLPLFALDQLFRLSIDRFDIVYSRPGNAVVGDGYAGDHNSPCDYPDLAVARRFGNVEILEETCLRTGADYNTTKLEILAKAHIFVAAQGGGAHLLSCFDNSLLLVLHREGREYPHAYAEGPYKYLSDPPPILLVARDNEQLVQGIKVISSASVRDGVPLVDDHGIKNAAALRL